MSLITVLVHQILFLTVLILLNLAKLNITVVLPIIPIFSSLARQFFIYSHCDSNTNLLLLKSLMYIQYVRINNLN